MKKKIIFFINHPTPYQIEFFDEMNKICTLKVIFLEKKLKNYNFSFNTRKYVEYSNFNKNIIFKSIKKFNPQFIIIGGYKLNYTRSIINLCSKNKINYLFWLEKINLDSYYKKIILNNYFKYFLKNCYGILAVGNEARKYYSQFNNNTINFHYSIKVSSFKKKKFFQKNLINFLYVGQLIKRKNVINLIKAFQKLNDFKTTLTIIGNGDLEKKSKKITKNNKNIKILKFLNRNQLMKYYLKTDVFILPSKYDGWGVVVMEAMNYKCSIISTSSCGISKEFIKNGFNGKISGCEIDDLYRSIKFYSNNKKLIKMHAYRSWLKVTNSNVNSKNSAKKLISFLNE